MLNYALGTASVFNKSCFVIVRLAHLYITKEYIKFYLHFTNLHYLQVISYYIFFTNNFTNNNYLFACVMQCFCLI